MRIIKFRGRRTDIGEYIYGDLLTSNGTECEISDWNDVVYSRYDVDPDTVGQFTGLLDKNGKEIYEGDVIHVQTFHNKGQRETWDFRDIFSVEDLKGYFYYGYTSDVTFEDGGFFLSNNNECDTSLCVLFGDMRHSFPIFECEVLGNIHDNPELLKGGKE